MSWKFRIVNTAIMSIFLGAFMSGYVTWINIGFIDGYSARWFKAWLMATPAAFIGVLVLAPLVQKFTKDVLKID